MTREQFEIALDAGRLQTLIIDRKGDHWYYCRRNGKTKTWKTQPDRFEIPVKFRFRDCIRVEAKYFHNGTVDEWFRITGAA